MEEKKSNALTVVLVIVICLLVGVLGWFGGKVFYENEGRQNSEPTPVEDGNNKDKQYTYSDIAGIYEAKYEYTEVQCDDVENMKAELKLYEEGTFKISMQACIESSYYGNYLIDNNTIKLYPLYFTGSGCGVSKVSETAPTMVEFKIKDDKTLSNDKFFVTTISFKNKPDYVKGNGDLESLSERRKSFNAEVDCLIN